MLAAYFAPLDAKGGLLGWLFGGGIGTNIGASLIWGLTAGVVGYLLARKLRAAWVRLHVRHDEQAQSLKSLHRKIDQLTKERHQ